MILNNFKCSITVSLVIVISLNLTRCNGEEEEVLDLCNVPTNLTKYKYKNHLMQTCECKSTITTTTTNCAIQKCCALGFEIKKGACLRTEQDLFEIDVYNQDQFLYVWNFSDGIKIGWPNNCKYVYSLRRSPDEENIYVQEDGKLWTSNGFVENEQFCIDKASMGISAFICYNGENEDEDFTPSIIGMIISLPFLVATFVAYALLPHRTILMKSLMCYVLSLAIGYLCLLVAHTSVSLCLTRGYLGLFAFISSFIWMTLMCYEIYSSFQFKENYEDEKVKFIRYCCFVNGLALAHLLLVSLITYFGREFSWYHPGIGYGQCWLDSGFPELLYLYGPITILITINFVLFGITVRKIKKLTREHPVGDRENFSLYLKIVFAMGLNWSFEIISWLVNWRVGHVPSYVWYLTDFCNACYGVLIFFIFVFKRKIWMLIRKRFKPEENEGETEAMQSELKVLP